MIVVRNFKSIPENTMITVHIPKIQNPDIAPGTTKLQVMLVQYDNRWRTVLNDAKTLTLNINPITLVTLGSTAVVMPISNFKLIGIFEVTFELKLGNDLPENSYLKIELPGYDSMLVPEEDTIICYIDGYITPCTAYHGLDWILFKTEAG